MWNLLIGLLLFTSSAADSMVIIRDHKALAFIVIKANASEQVREAALTLQKYLERSTGVLLPISNHPVYGISIFIGNNSYLKKFSLDTSSLDEDGFILKGLDAHHYLIIGGSDWGTEFGVYEFLERYVGVRWLMPGDIGIEVPQRNTIDIPSLKVEQNPAYLSRQLSPINIGAKTSLGQWGRFNRARGRIQFHHNMLHLLPPSKYAGSHPVFYPFYNGKINIPANDEDYKWQPNFSAPGIISVAANEIISYFRRHPEVSSYSLGMNDSRNFDESPASLARRSGRKNYLGLEDVSEDYFKWANEVVAKVLKVFPDKQFGMLAYNNIAEPPPTTVNAHIIPFITYERMRWADPRLQRAGHELNERWSNVSPTLGWYDYAYGLCYMVPRVWFHEMKDYLSWGASHHVKYYYGELYPNWGEGPKAWVLTKLLWNPHQNVDSLLDDWYVHAAGQRAAPKLKAFYALWEKFWTKDIYQSDWNRNSGQYLPFSNLDYLLNVPVSYLTMSDSLMAEALRLTETSVQKERVTALKQMWDLYKAAVISYQSNHRDKATRNSSNLLNKETKMSEQDETLYDLLKELRKDPLFAPSVNSMISWIPTYKRMYAK